MYKIQQTQLRHSYMPYMCLVPSCIHNFSIPCTQLRLPGESFSRQAGKARQTDCRSQSISQPFLFCLENSKRDRCGVPAVSHVALLLDAPLVQNLRGLFDAMKLCPVCWTNGWERGVIRCQTTDRVYLPGDGPVETENYYWILAFVVVFLRFFSVFCFDGKRPNQVYCKCTVLSNDSDRHI